MTTRIIRKDQFDTKPWKNGGGTTHEIHAEPGPRGFAWRLSVAEVAQDGPFSRFDGLSRVLTVIEGAGMALQGADSTLRADLLKPVRFSGEAAIHAVLDEGPIRDFNLIYDPAEVSGAVQMLEGAVEAGNAAGAGDLRPLCASGPGRGIGADSDAG